MSAKARRRRKSRSPPASQRTAPAAGPGCVGAAIAVRRPYVLSSAALSPEANRGRVCHGQTNFPVNPFLIIPWRPAPGFAMAFRTPGALRNVRRDPGDGFIRFHRISVRARDRFRGCRFVRIRIPPLRRPFSDLPAPADGADAGARRRGPAAYFLGSFSDHAHYAARAPRGAGGRRRVEFVMLATAIAGAWSFMSGTVVVTALQALLSV